MFRFQDGRLLTRERFVTQVCDNLVLAGLNPAHYAGHSFHSRAGTTAAQGGLPEATIKMLGRWESCAYLLYVMTPKEQLASFSVKPSLVPRPSSFIQHTKEH